MLIQKHISEFSRLGDFEVTVFALMALLSQDFILQMIVKSSIKALTENYWTNILKIKHFMQL